MPDLALVIVSYNTRELLRDCLDALAATRVTEIAVIIVVDNASADGSAAMVREQFPWVRLIASEVNLGFAGGNNLALRAVGFAARGDEAPRSAAVGVQPLAEFGERVPELVLLLNPDTAVRPSAVSTLQDFMRGATWAAAAGPRLVYPDGRLQHSAFRFPGLAQTALDLFPPPGRLARVLESRLNGRYARAGYEADAPFEVDTLLGACLMVRGTAIRQVGLLDEHYFMYAEELDWCRRMTDSGWRLYCVPTAEVVHFEGQSTRQFREAMFVELWRSRLRLFERHHSRATRWLLRALVWLGASVRARRPGDERIAAYRQVARLARQGDMKTVTR